MQDIKEFWKSDEFLTFANDFDRQWAEFCKLADNKVDAFMKSTLYARGLIESYHAWLMRNLPNKS